MNKPAFMLTITLTFALPYHSVAVAASNQPPPIEPDIVYGHKDGLALTMDIHHPDADPNGAAILFMVSGGWYSRWSPPENTRPMFAPYLELGYTMIAVRHGSSPRYTIPEAVNDVRQAVRFVRSNARKFNIDPERLGVFGMSAGGHLSLVLGTTGVDESPKAKGLDRVSSRVAAVVAFVPPTDLRVMVWDAPDHLPAYDRFPALELPLKEAATYSPLVHVTKDDAPSLVIMGGKDTLVPPIHGQWIADAFKKHNVRNKLIILPEADHSLGGNQNRANIVREAISWFDIHLAKHN